MLLPDHCLHCGRRLLGTIELRGALCDPEHPMSRADAGARLFGFCDANCETLHEVAENEPEVADARC